MKRHLIYLLIALLPLAVANKAAAQRNGSLFLGAEGVLSYYPPDGAITQIGKASSLGFGVMLDKNVIHCCDLRLHIAFYGVVPKRGFDSYGKVSADVKFDILAACMGFDISRPVGIYAVLGLGVASGFDTKSMNIGARGLIEGGLGVSFRLNDKIDTYIEFDFENIGSFASGNQHIMMSLGIRYLIGHQHITF